MSSLRCSFCHKSPEDVGKLISTPTDDPRALICDQCIVVCADIIASDVAETRQDEPESPEDTPHPLLTHPLASKLIEAIEAWMQEESMGEDRGLSLSQVRRMAQHMLQDVSAMRTGQK